MSSRSGAVTTVAGGETCKGRAPQNDPSPGAYQQQYAGLADRLKDMLGAYDSAIESLDAHPIGDTSGALGTEIRADARLVDVPRLYGCYAPNVQSSLEHATDALAGTLDALSCAGANMCNRKQTEILGLISQARPQERTYIAALNAYAAQFGGEQIALPHAAGYTMRV